jgi:hypothetical protein
MSGQLTQDHMADSASPPRWMRPVRTWLIVTGLLVMSYAILGAVTDPTDRLGGHAAFLLAVLLGHDGLLMPLAMGLGVLAGRVVPMLARGVVAGAMSISGALVFVALPFVLGFGAKPDEPSALPLNYGRGLVIMLAVVWTAAAVTVLYRRRRHAAAGRATAGHDSRD